MNKKKNLVSALVLQIITMLSGFILPRLIISTFGSEINGLVSSITQFLSFISLLEGGLGAVVLAELYKPIESNDDIQTNAILQSCQRFFSQLAIVFVIFTVTIGIGYGICMRDKYSFAYVFTLVLILSFITIVQYLFSITFKLLLQAQQRIYIVNTVASVTVALNLVVTVILIYIYPSIHIIKLFSAIVFLIQPIVYAKCTERKFHKKNRNRTGENYTIKNRWDGFAQNLAHFVNLNTDIAVITIFLSLSDISVYSVYMLPITALRSVIVSLTNSYQSALGKYYAQGDYAKLKENSKRFADLNTILSTILFSTCTILINQFVRLYTKGITDANYFQPLFALTIIIANMIYCIREPYRLLILSAGNFKETNFGAVFEAILNLLISIILIRPLGLFGVAVGTLIAILYRFIYFAIYLRKEILQKDFKDYLPSVMRVFVVLVIIIASYYFINLQIENYVMFVLYGGGIFLVVTSIVMLLFHRSIVTRRERE